MIYFTPLYAFDFIPFHFLADAEAHDRFTLKYCKLYTEFFAAGEEEKTEAGLA